jgi:2',3'-cyclic-nucleotide 2'-phosphodiesterase (5'-nucleotidase family)
MTAALRRAAGVDAAFVGNTTFGGGLPSADVTRAAFESCVRFDGPLFVATVTGRRLRRLLAASNQDVRTPFDQRGGEFNVADGPATLDDAKTYRIVTNDWGAKNSGRYFGEPAIAWEADSGATLRAAVLRQLRASAARPRDRQADR